MTRLPPIPRSDRPAELLFPRASPFRMAPRIAEALADANVQTFVGAATRLKDHTREVALHAAFGAHVGEARHVAGAIRQATLAGLDLHLAAFITRAENNGIHVHYAPDAASARDIVLTLAKAREVRTAVKAKSMVTEEIQLLDALLGAGIDTIETDLGELVLQLDDDAPSHLVTPMIHKDRVAAGHALSRLDPSDTPPDLATGDPASLTAHARKALRKAFAAADLGITGANFLCAETGEVVLCTNEGNGRLSSLVGHTHIAVTGIEKVVPTLDHLALLLELLARSATGQPLTVYTSFVRAPTPGREVHLVLVDNGRSKVLADTTFRSALGCIRCGACLNTCPVYRSVGGHAYGSVWPGPIGAVLTPLMRGPETTPDLPWASTLCGACHSACPVDIDLPALLVAHRARAFANGSIPSRIASRVVRVALGGKLRWRIASAIARALTRTNLGPKRAWNHGERRLPAPTERFAKRWKRMTRKRNER